MENGKIGETKNFGFGLGTASDIVRAELVLLGPMNGRKSKIALPLRPDDLKQFKLCIKGIEGIMNEVIKKKLYEVVDILENYNAVSKAELNRLHERADRVLDQFIKLVRDIAIERELQPTQRQMCYEINSDIEEMIKSLKQIRGLTA
jgi:hypothetical protein